ESSKSKNDPIDIFYYGRAKESEQQYAELFVGRLVLIEYVLTSIAMFMLWIIIYQNQCLLNKRLEGHNLAAWHNLVALLTNVFTWDLHQNKKLSIRDVFFF
ncbi:hypothetical protein ACJX0J_033243, partial [Zea mays]